MGKQFLFCCLLIVIMDSSVLNVKGQTQPVFKALPSLPDTQGLAGMFGGVSDGKLFCMGGANFPDKKPWEGGKKKWYDDIYMLAEGANWVKLKQKLPYPLAYGVSVTCKDKIILIGGNDDTKHSAKVTAYSWRADSLEIIPYPDLPVTMANMCGSVVNSLIVIAGGNSTPVSLAMNKCFALDMENISTGWFELPSWPGRECLLPLCAVDNSCFYLFGGETVDVSNDVKTRLILDDGFKLTVQQVNGKWIGSWEKIAHMLKGISAVGNPLPVLNNGDIVFWGGVDALTALQKDPVTHPGMSNEIIIYSPQTNRWRNAGSNTLIKARVTLPVVLWNNKWVFISGETKPAIRTNTVFSINK